MERIACGRYFRANILFPAIGQIRTEKQSLKRAFTRLYTSWSGGKNSIMNFPNNALRFKTQKNHLNQWNIAKKQTREQLKSISGSTWF